MNGRNAESARRRPCGACRALVPAETGCEHWRPGTRYGKADEARRARNARYQRQARERARQDVAAFRVAQGPLIG